MSNSRVNSTATGERWRQLEEVFHTASDLSGAERAAFLERACGGDAEFRAELESLLACDAGSREAIENLVLDEVKTLPERIDAPEVGLRLGPYQLLRKIGSGGMGVVYQAARTEPNYVHVVAIKLIRPGMASEMVQARFRQERQILANLRHPNIAAILDGGNAPDGRPFIVMEYVEGMSILDYCEKRHLGVRQRVALFRDVCAAVQHAHQKLVIHRDIKPANILVTADGIPKLLDFGVAKLLIPELVPDSSPPTETAQGFMTPDYASPEQVRGEPLSTATDVYSLGVVLYELLTAQRPYRVTGQPPSEIERVVCREEPVRPSDHPEIPARLKRDLSGDLNNIILMALRKEPERRYGSAQEFSDDLLRYLDGFPVAARKDTFRYRTGKLVRRNKAAAIATALVALSLCGGMIATTWHARRSARRFDQVRKLASSMIFETNDSLRDLPGSTAARANLVANALQYLDTLSKEAGGDSGLLLELSRAYQRIGDVQGSPYVPNLGRTSESLQSYRKALGIAEQLHKAEPANATITAWLVAVCIGVGEMQVYLGDTAGALKNYERAMRLSSELHSTERSSLEYGRLLSSSYLHMGEAHMRARQPFEALKQYRNALRIIEESPDHTEAALRSIHHLHRRIGSAALETGPPQVALESYEKSAAIREKLLALNPRNQLARRDVFAINIDLGNTLGGLRNSIGDPVRAEKHFRRSLEIASELATEDPLNEQAKSDLAFGWAKLGAVKRHTSQPQAVEFLTKGVALNRMLLDRAPENNELRRWLAAREEMLGDAYEDMGKRDEAFLHLVAGNGHWKEAAARDPSHMVIRLGLMASYCRLCDVYRERGRRDEAMSSMSQALAILPQLEGNRSSVYTIYELARCYEAFNKLSPAEDWRKKTDAAWSEWRGRGLEQPGAFRRPH